ncbi:MAG TPA: PilZ domain-containing protein [Myxococcota bacterium]|nr:PilZ domain-containing protein [Myxococcota bacterium]
MATKRSSKRSVRKPAKRAARKATKRRKVVRRAAKKATTRRKAARKVSRKTSRKVAARMAPPAVPFKFLDLDAAPRCRSRIPVEIEIAGRRESGAIADMSASGARIVGVKLDMPAGTPLQIRYASGTSPVLLSAELVRLTDDGFAVKILPR